MTMRRAKIRTKGLSTSLLFLTVYTMSSAALAMEPAAAAANSVAVLCCPLTLSWGTADAPQPSPRLGGLLPSDPVAGGLYVMWDKTLLVHVMVPVAASVR